MTGTFCIVDVPLFTGEIMVFYGYEHAALMTTMREHKMPEAWIAGLDRYKDRPHIAGVHYDIPGRDASLVWTRQKDVPTLVHELTHATFATLESVGVKSDRGNNETFCYMLDHFVGEVLKANDSPQQQDYTALYEFLRGVSDHITKTLATQ